MVCMVACNLTEIDTQMFVIGSTRIVAGSSSQTAALRTDHPILEVLFWGHLDLLSFWSEQPHPCHTPVNANGVRGNGFRETRWLLFKVGGDQILNEEVLRSKICL